MKSNRKSSRSESGQALIIITFAIIGLIGLTGLTVDGGLAYSDRRNAQNAADTAAMAGARAQIRGENVSNVAQSIATANGYNNNGTSNIVSIESKLMPYTAGICPSTYHDITVEITSHLKTTFSTVIGVNEVTNKVIAKSRVCDVSGGGPLYAGSAVFATRLASCGNGQQDKSLFIQGSSKLQVWGGDLGTASLDGNCIDFTGGEAQLKMQESGTECADVVTAAPSTEISDAEWSSLKPQNGCGRKIFGQTFAEPPSDLGITCTNTAQKVSNSMSPGNWTGDFPPSGVSTLNAGVYCVTGDFVMNNNSTLTGNGVTVVLKTGELKWNGGAEIKLSAPASGATKGLLIYLPPTNTNDVDVNGNSNAKITGTILAQNSDCYFAGSGQLQKQTLQFICSTWGMNGNGQAEIMYDSTFFFAPLTNPTIMLLQ